MMEEKQLEMLQKHRPVSQKDSENQLPKRKNSSLSVANPPEPPRQISNMSHLSLPVDSRKTQNNAVSQLGEGHSSKLNQMRPSFAGTSKSNNSSMCIHGALEPERLETRYDTRLADHENHANSRYPNLRDNKLKRDEAERLQHADDSKPVTSSQKRISSGPFNKRSRRGTSNQNSLHQDSSNLSKHLTHQTAHAKPTLAVAELTLGPCGHGIFSTMSSNQDGTGVAHQRRSSQFQDARATNNSNKKLSGANLTNTMQLSHNALQVLSPGLQQQVPRAISSGQVDFKTTNRKSRPFSAIVRNGTQVTSPPQQIIEQIRSGVNQFTNITSPTIETTTLPFSPQMQQGSNHKTQPNSRIKSAYQRVDKDFINQSVVGESMQLRTSASGRPQRIPGGTTNTASSFGVQHSKEGIMSQVLPLSGQLGNNTTSKFFYPLPARPLSGKQQKWSSSNQYRLRKHFEPLIFRNQQSAVTAACQSQVQTPFTSGGLWPGGVLGHYHQNHHNQHHQTMQQHLKPDSSQDLSTAAQQMSHTSGTQTAVKIGKLQDASKESPSRKLLCADPSSEAHESSKQIRLSAQVFARTHSGVQKINSGPIALETPQNTTSVNTNLLQNEVLRKSLQSTTVGPHQMPMLQTLKTPPELASASAGVGILQCQTTKAYKYRSGSAMGTSPTKVAHRGVTMITAKTNQNYRAITGQSVETMPVTGNATNSGTAYGSTVHQSEAGRSTLQTPLQRNTSALDVVRTVGTQKQQAETIVNSEKVPIFPDTTESLLNQQMGTTLEETEDGMHEDPAEHLSHRGGLMLIYDQAAETRHVSTLKSQLKSPTARQTHSKIYGEHFDRLKCDPIIQEHNMQPLFQTRQPGTISIAEILQKAFENLEPQAPILASNNQMLTLLRRHALGTGLSLGAQKRLANMESCGLEGNMLRKSVQEQNRIALQLGLSRDLEAETGLKLAKSRVLRNTGFLVSKDQVEESGMKNEMEKLEEQARIEGQLKASRFKRRKFRKKLDTETSKSSSSCQQHQRTQSSSGIFGARKLVQNSYNKSHKRRSRLQMSQDQKQLQAQLHVAQLKSEQAALTIASVDLLKEGVYQDCLMTLSSGEKEQIQTESQIVNSVQNSKRLSQCSDSQGGRVNIPKKSGLSIFTKERIVEHYQNSTIVASATTVGDVGTKNATTLKASQQSHQIRANLNQMPRNTTEEKLRSTRMHDGTAQSSHSPHNSTFESQKSISLGKKKRRPIHLSQEFKKSRAATPQSVTNPTNAAAQQTENQQQQQRECMTIIDGVLASDSNRPPIELNLLNQSPGSQRSEHGRTFDAKLTIKRPKSQAERTQPQDCTQGSAGAKGDENLTHPYTENERDSLGSIYFTKDAIKLAMNHSRPENRAQQTRPFLQTAVEAPQMRRTPPLTSTEPVDLQSVDLASAKLAVMSNFYTSRHKMNKIEVKPLQTSTQSRLTGGGAADAQKKYQQVSAIVIHRRASIPIGQKQRTNRSMAPAPSVQSSKNVKQEHERRLEQQRVAISVQNIEFLGMTGSRRDFHSAIAEKRRASSVMLLLGDPRSNQAVKDSAPAALHILASNHKSNERSSLAIEKLLTKELQGGGAQNYTSTLNQHDFQGISNSAISGAIGHTSAPRSCANSTKFVKQQDMSTKSVRPQHKSSMVMKKQGKKRKRPMADLTSSVFTFAENEDSQQRDEEPKKVAQALVQTSGSWVHKDFLQVNQGVHSSHQTIPMVMRESMNSKAESDRNVGGGRQGSNMYLDYQVQL